MTVLRAVAPEEGSRAVAPEEASRVVTGREVVQELVAVLERQLPLVPPPDRTYQYLRDLHAVLDVHHRLGTRSALRR